MFLKKNNFILSDIKLSQRGKEIRFGLLILAVLLAGALTYRYLARSDILHDIVKPAIRAGTKLPLNYIRGLFSSPPKISIDIKYKDYQKILQKRDEALNTGLLFSSDDDYVPATIRYNNEDLPIEIRLKGDALDHIAGDKWSFRIKVKGENALFGMKRFSIQDPKRRVYLDEWVFHQLLKKEDLPFLRYKFIDVELNGKRLGVYALEEHFSGELLTNSRLPEGPILKFDERLFFDLVLRSDNPNRAHIEDPQDMIYISNPIETFEPSKLADPAIYTQFQKAKNMLEGFRMGALKPSQVFDIEKLAKFYAIADLTGAVHATSWTNIRLYYNPITSLLEPIGYDAFNKNEGPIVSLSSYPKPKELEDNSILDFGYALFKDTEFFAEYMKQLDRMSADGYMEEFFSGIDKELQDNIRIIWRDEPWYSFSGYYSNISPDAVYRNRKYVKNALNPAVGIRAYLKETAPKTIVEVANIQPLPVVFQGEILPGHVPHEPLTFRDFELPKLPEILNYKMLGLDAVQTAAIIPWPVLDLNEIEEAGKNRMPHYYLFDFLSADYYKKTISVKEGSWKLFRDLVLPAGFTFIAGAGSEIDIMNSAAIISHSSLRFIGSEGRPVKIISSDKTSRGIWVYAPEKSYLENAVIANNLLNFYESPSFINKVYFSGPSSYDDTLHITRSDFELTDSFFKDVFADALDVDFGNGTILRTSFVNSGNDAMDFSGSVVSVLDSQIKNAGDKGISAGEDSRIDAKNLKISDSKICLASKDFSTLKIEEAAIINCEIGVAVFQKKPEFGPAEAKILNLKIENAANDFLVEVGSLLEVDGRIMEDKEVNLKDKLYVE